MPHRHVYNRPASLAADRGTDWRDRAACREHPEPELWFPDGRSSKEGTLPNALEAIAVCASCPVREDCLAAGMREEFGVWGGTTEEQRQSMRRRARREARA